MNDNIDWSDWTRRLQQALGALMAETVGQKAPSVEMWDLVQGVIELEAEAAALAPYQHARDRTTNHRGPRGP